MKRMPRKRTTGTPIRTALLQESLLMRSVQDGLGAMAGTHRKYIDGPVKADFADSPDLDDAMREAHPDENRWDYLLGHVTSGTVVGLEPHSAKAGEISTVIGKRKAAGDQLRPHWNSGRPVSAWLWVASGKVQFANTERARVRLDQNGILFVGKKVLQRHLPDGDSGLNRR